MACYFRFGALVLCIGFAFSAKSVAAQGATTLTTESKRAVGAGRGLGFTYGWKGEDMGRNAEGKLDMRNPPTIRQVLPDSPAARAGLQAGDVIVSVNGRDGRNPPLFNDFQPGSKVVLRIRRGDDEREIALVWSPKG